MSETATEGKLRTISPEDLVGFTERVQIDPNANAFSRPSPIPDAIYQAQITVPVKTGGKMDRDPLKGGTDKNGNGYFIGEFDVKVLASATATVPDSVLKGKSKTLRARVTTFEKTDEKGLTTNEMATVCYAAGAPPASDALGDLGFAFLQALSAGAKLGVVTQWQASHYVAVPGKQWKDKKIERRGMTSFPKNMTTNPATGELAWDGTYNPTITVTDPTGGTIELTARAEAIGFVRL